MPVKGLNLFSRSNCCLPSTLRSTFRSGQIAYSSMVLLIWKILSVIASGAGPGDTTVDVVTVETRRAQSPASPVWHRDPQHPDGAGILRSGEGQRPCMAMQVWEASHSCGPSQDALPSVEDKPHCPPAPGHLAGSPRPAADSPPLEMLNLIPKSPLGPPGLWLAVRMIPPMALIFLMMQDTAGVERIPFCPMTRRPI